MTIQKMTRKQLVPVATAILNAAREKNANGKKAGNLDGDPIAAQLTFGWLDNIDEYCHRYGEKNRKPMMAMIRAGMVKFAAAWNIDHPALKDDVTAWLKSESQRLAKEQAEAERRQAEHVMRVVMNCRTHKITKAKFDALLTSDDLEPTHLPSQLKAWLGGRGYDEVRSQLND